MMSFLLGLGGRNLANVDVAEADLRPVSLELDGALGNELQGAIVEVVQHLAGYRWLVVEPDPDARSDHLNPEGVPLADGIIGLDQGPFAGVIGVVVPQSARALGGAVPRLAGVVDVPDLHLRIAAKIDSRISVVADHEPIDIELEVAEVFGGGEVNALAVGDDLALGSVDGPVEVTFGVPL